jgi:antitoxin MazE
MRTNVKRWGNSLSVRIPRIIADEIGLKEDSAVEILMKKKKLVISPLEKPKMTLSELLSKVNKSNLHAEVDTGKPVGGEVW